MKSLIFPPEPNAKNAIGEPAFRHGNFIVTPVAGDGYCVVQRSPHRYLGTYWSLALAVAMIRRAEREQPRKRRRCQGAAYPSRETLAEAGDL